MLARVMLVGLLAGLVAGLLVAVLQQATTTPLILVAETYEKQGEVGSHKDHDHGAHAEGWKPADGLPRFLFTGLATVATAVGVAFLLLAGMIIADDPIDERRALAWAAAGFVATGLAPAVGLAPDLPGSGAGDLVARQLWWIGTAVATAVALWAFLRGESLFVRLGAVVLLLMLHLIGAPHPHTLDSKVPAEIAAEFAALSLVVQGLLWGLAAIAVGVLWPKFRPRPS